MNTRRHTGSLALLILLAAIGLAAKDDKRLPKVPVFVTSAGATGGFTDPDQQRTDSVKDIIQAIDRRDLSLGMAQRADEAKIVLVVLGRRSIGDKSEVEVLMKVGETTVSLTGSGNTYRRANGRQGTNYTSAAGHIVGQVDKWIEANRAKLDGR